MASDIPLSNVPQKRPRPIKSCLQCRKKKLKCSQEVPCDQCTKIGNHDKCAYSEYAPDSTRLPNQVLDSSTDGNARKQRRIGASDHDQQQASSPGRSKISGSVDLKSAPVGVVEDLQGRVANLEQIFSLSSTHVADGGSNLSLFKHTTLVNTNGVGSVSTKGLIDSQKSSTRFYGQNQKNALLLHFDEARTFMTRLQANPVHHTLETIRHDLRALQDCLRTRKPKPEVTASYLPLLQQIPQLLPPRSVCQTLVSMYVENFEHELRVLHVPTFLTDLETVWNPQGALSSPQNDVLIQLVLVLAIASSLDPHELLKGEKPDGKPLDATYCDLAEAWIDELTPKKRSRFSALQTQTLLLMAKQCRVEKKNIWTSTGSLVRSAMLAGLHRDPSETTKISSFQSELRRRLWYTIVEMDLQTSLTQGMPTMVCTTDFTTRCPASIDDVDLHPDLTELPESRSLEQWTDSLSHALLAQWLPERLTGARLLSNMISGINYEEALGHARKLDEKLRDLPSPLKFDHNLDDDNHKVSRVQTRIQFDLHIRRSILNLCGPFVQASSAKSHFTEARKLFIQSATTISCYQDIFDPEFSDFTIDTTKNWDRFHICAKHDLMHAGLGLCLEIKWSSVGSLDRCGAIGLVSASTPATSTYSRTSLIKTVDDNLNPLIRRLGRFGSDFKDLGCLSAVLSSVRTRNTEAKQVAIENAIKETIDSSKRHLEKLGLFHVSSGSTTHHTPASQATSQDLSLDFGFGLDAFIDEQFDFGAIDLNYANDWQYGQAPV